MSDSRETKFAVNDRDVSLQCDPDRSVLEILREELHLTGPKYGCGEGACGACTILVDGKPTFSCSIQIDTIANKNITTIEGLAKNDALHPVQQAFLAEGAYQCGYCTAGMILAAAALLERNKKPGREDIVKAMNGHLCRCCTYPKIIAAIQRAAEVQS